MTWDLNKCVPNARSPPSLEGHPFDLVRRRRCAEDEPFREARATQPARPVAFRRREADRPRQHREEKVEQEDRIQLLLHLHGVSST